MKKLIYYFSFLFFIFNFSNIHAQEQMCKAEALANKPDVVIQKEFTEIGKVSGVHISVESITDLTNNQKLNAIDLEYTLAEGNTTVSVLLDPDEADALLKFLDYLNETVFKSAAPAADKEFSFTSQSGFEAGCYWTKGWYSYIKLDIHNTHTNIELNREALMEFQSLVKQAKNKM